MFDEELLTKIVALLAEALHPEQIILFGSHAWGNPSADSDVDLFIIVNEKKEPGYRIAAHAYRAIRGVAVPVDFVIRSHAEVEEYRDVPASLEYAVMHKGVVLYG